jgi:hypothetical protein
VGDEPNPNHSPLILKNRSKTEDRCPYLELSDVLRIVGGTYPPYRAIFALAFGVGLGASATLSLINTDVEVARRQMRARSTKA